MNKIKELIKEVISKHLKKEDKCNCGCHTCENVGNSGVLINESLNKKINITENLQYHVDNKLPLTENTFRYGSQAFLDLWAEARYLYVREAIHVNDDDKEILTETNLGEYGVYENIEVPLDLPLEDEVGDKEDIKTSIGTSLMPYTDLLDKLKDLYDSESEDRHKERFALIHDELLNAIMDKNQEQIDNILRKYNNYLPVGLNEEKKNPPLGKPKRGGSKKFYVYVKNPKTKKIKKVSFGDTSGLSAKINNPEARRAFAARHDCKNKTDKTKASYWSCRLPRYAKLLGLKSSFSGFW
jgi:hypothetical protein